MVPLNSLAAGHENVGYVEIDGKYHPLRIFYAVAGVPEDRHTCIITWPSDDAKSHDATALVKAKVARPVQVYGTSYPGRSKIRCIDTLLLFRGSGWAS